ncbi:hypothetical protein AN643_03750 [Candidatus Epulonipiscioides saccharophilum]|nr:hypothetical protein AN643_03750 [Epulopiscium sp. SCG-B10WGA-EpuloB]
MTQANSNKIKDSRADKIFYTIIYIILAIVLVVVIYPLFCCGGLVFGSSVCKYSGDIMLFPKGNIIEGSKDIGRYEDMARIFQYDNLCSGRNSVWFSGMYTGRICIIEKRFTV